MGTSARMPISSALIRMCISLSLIFGQLVIPQKAIADTLEDCRISAGQWNIVSLGFPLRKERLANLDSPKILVIPFQLKGEPAFSLSASDLSNFSLVTQDIRDFSSNKSNVQFIFNKTIELPQTALELDEIKRNVNNTWAKDFANSTWGFVTKSVIENDPTINYSGVDAVLMFGKSSKVNQEIAEAMMFSSDAGIKFNPIKSNGGNWFDPLKTDEGQISNVVLMYNNLDRLTIAHEVMHLYGLTDLYGSPDGPGSLSLMSDNSLNLLSYEKWILGWLPSDHVQCFTNVSTGTLYKVTLDNSRVNQVVVIRTGDRENYVIETTRLKGKRYLAFYSVNNDLRPPLKLFQERAFRQPGGVEIEDYTVMGSQFATSKFTLLVSNYDSTSTTLHLVPSSLTSSNEFKDLVLKSAELRANIVREIEERFAAEAKIAADKAAADLKSKQDAEAKAAAEKAAATTLVSPSKITITCIKGKIVKKVTAVKAKCPPGFKKR
jgi:hypothetical protein